MVDAVDTGADRTETVDYAIVLEGSVVLVLDDVERALAPGDVVIQRGTDHAWENRGDADARVVFVLVDGAFAQPLLDTLPGVGPSCRS